ncbi:hypothetical protein BH23THE1_BH23THE1_12360 [soil metagenome]
MNLQRILLVVSIIAGIIIPLVISNTNVFGFFHEQKTEKPTIMIRNPDLVPFFDELYSKHPGITQKDIDYTWFQLSNYCESIIDKQKTEYNLSNLSNFEKNFSKSDFAHTLGLAVCLPPMHTTLTLYLEDLGYDINSENPSPKIGPQLIQ